MRRGRDEEGKYIFRILNWNFFTLYTCIFVRSSSKLSEYININCITIRENWKTMFCTTCLT